LNSCEGNGGGNTIGEGALFGGLDVGIGDPIAGAAEFKYGLGELAEGRGAAANGVGTPPGTGALTGAVAAGRIPAEFASLE